MKSWKIREMKDNLGCVSNLLYWSTSGKCDKKGLKTLAEA